MQVSQPQFQSTEAIKESAPPQAAGMIHGKETKVMLIPLKPPLPGCLYRFIIGFLLSFVGGFLLDLGAGHSIAFC